MSDKILNEILQISVENRDRLVRVEARLDKMDERFDKMDERFDKMDERFDKMDERFDNIESELGTVKDAVLDVSRKVKGHDLEIKELQEKVH